VSAQPRGAVDTDGGIKALRGVRSEAKRIQAGRGSVLFGHPSRRRLAPDSNMARPGPRSGFRTDFPCVPMIHSSRVRVSRVETPMDPERDVGGLQRPPRGPGVVEHVRCLPNDVLQGTSPPSGVGFFLHQVHHGA
jgi:hypothetical protein